MNNITPLKNHDPPALLKRLSIEMMAISADPHPNIYCWPHDGDMLNWAATIIGPVDTPYEGGAFNLTISIPLQYPFKPPKLRFITKIYHPNVHTNGNFHLDILSWNWSPGFFINRALIEVLELIKNPHLDDPIYPQMVVALKQAPKQFEATAREWTRQHANRS